MLLTDGGKLECYAEATEDEHKLEWVDAMQDEMQSLHDNHTFELVKLPKGKRALEQVDLQGEATRTHFTTTVQS